MGKSILARMRQLSSGFNFWEGQRRELIEMIYSMIALPAGDSETSA
jgi:hypothetical protein